ncbi:MAG: U32 family peptidase [Oscillospiraceae bacterium]|nr:U32 family peptidase [Oscillospiraceae bacterium]
MTKPEILAPAGSRESALAAVNCGANAIYLGGKALNARRNAGNFDDDELKDIVAYCHARGVKVYQTINTVIFDDEEDELISAAKTAALAGVDGIIVQDIGVLSALRECVPNIPLFASTQMAVHNLAGAREAEDMGCEMVVLARELTAK